MRRWVRNRLREGLAFLVGGLLGLATLAVWDRLFMAESAFRAGGGP